MGRERTLVLCKPDAVQRGLVGAVIERFERKGLKVVGMKMMRVDDDLASRHYREHLEKLFYPNLRDFVTSSPIVAMAIEGEDAVAVVRTLVGATNPREASPGTIRGDFGLDLTKNLVHGSDSLESAERELALFFSDDELHDYELTLKVWM
jgi:nucleoside-diphosphate kinase